MSKLSAKQLIQKLNPEFLGESLTVSDPKRLRNETANSAISELDSSIEELADDPYLDWFLADSERLRMFTYSLCVNNDVGRGVVPSSFVYRGYCQGCGPIMLDYATSSIVVGCPWCSCPRALRPLFQH